MSKKMPTNSIFWGKEEWEKELVEYINKIDRIGRIIDESDNSNLITGDETPNEKTKKYSFKESDVEGLLKLLININSNSNPEIRELLSQNFDNSIQDYIQDSKGKITYLPIFSPYNGTIFDRIKRIKPCLSRFFGCNQDEIGIAYKMVLPGNTENKEYDFCDLYNLATIDNMQKPENNPYRVVIGDCSFRNMVKQNDGLTIIIGNADFSGFKGQLPPNIIITGNALVDEHTRISGIENLYIGGESENFEEHVESAENKAVKIKKINSFDRYTKEDVNAWMNAQEEVRTWINAHKTIDSKEKPDSDPVYTSTDLKAAALTQDAKALKDLLDRIAPNESPLTALYKLTGGIIQDKLQDDNETKQ